MVQVTNGYEFSCCSIGMLRPGGVWNNGLLPHGEGEKEKCCAQATKSEMPTDGQRSQIRTQENDNKRRNQRRSVTKAGDQNQAQAIAGKIATHRANQVGRGWDEKGQWHQRVIRVVN